MLVPDSAMLDLVAHICVVRLPEAVAVVLLDSSPSLGPTVLQLVWQLYCRTSPETTNTILLSNAFILNRLQSMIIDNRHSTDPVNPPRLENSLSTTSARLTKLRFPPGGSRIIPRREHVLHASETGHAFLGKLDT